MQIEEVRLASSDPVRVGSFYRDRLGLEVVSGPDCVEVRIGRSNLVFVREERRDTGVYHFAVNVPEHSFLAAKAWLGERVQLNRLADGSDSIFFESWNASAIYFRDPDRNIGELIARHNLDHSAIPDVAFGADSLLEISEIACPVDDQSRAAEELGKMLEASPYLGSNFAIGDETGLVLLPEIDRPWLPDEIDRASVLPVLIRLRPKLLSRRELAGFPYVFE